MDGRLIYLDHAATTPTDPRVVEAMLPYFTENFGNASSVYALGTRSAEAIGRAREMVADIIGADRKEVTFTSGASEAINLALKGVAMAARSANKGRHVVTTAIEHHATLHAVDYLEALGFETTVLPVDETGKVSIEAVENAIREDTVIVSVMYANNEIGTIQPIADIGRICRRRGVTFHCDAVQGVGALDIDVDDLHVDLLSVSGHKFYGPKGVGMLYTRYGVEFVPQINGGQQEQGRRGGTENVAGIVGFAEALRIATDDQEENVAKVRALRDRLLEGVMAKIPDTHLNGHPTDRLPNNCHLTFEHIEGEKTTESLLVLLDQRGICASTGSACNSRAIEPSHVLQAIGLPASSAHSSLRFTLGKENTGEEIDFLIDVLPSLVERQRSVSPAYHRHLEAQRSKA